MTGHDAQVQRASGQCIYIYIYAIRFTVLVKRRPPILRHRRALVGAGAPPVAAALAEGAALAIKRRERRRGARVGEL